MVYRPVKAQNKAVQDIRDDVSSSHAWEFINQIFIEEKVRGHQLHVLASGGRRMLGLLATSAVIMNCEQHDHLWHMYTPDEIQTKVKDGALMHLPPHSGFRLVKVPIMPLGSYFINLRKVSNFDAQKEQLGDLERQRCQQVLNGLSQRPRQLLRLLAEGQTPIETANAMHVSIRTIDTYKTDIFRLCRTAWGFPEKEKLTYHFIEKKFNLFYRETSE